MKSCFQNTRLLLFILLILTVSMVLHLSWLRFGDSIPPASTETAVPSEVVRSWANTFPHTPLLAVSYTTEHFRDGRTPMDWVNDIKQGWPQIDFRYETGQVQSGWIEGTSALVFFKATGKSVWGAHERREEYRLIQNPQGHWLINDMRLVEELVL